MKEKEKEKEGQQQLSLEGVKTTPYFSLPVSTKEGRKVFIISKATRGNHPLETAEILPRVIVQTPEIPPSETKKNEPPLVKLPNSSPLKPRKKKTNLTITNTRT